MHGIFIDQHDTSHLLVVKACNHLTHQHFFLVIFVLPLRLLRFHVDLVEIVAGVEDERWGFWTKEEALVPLDVGSIQTIIFADLAVNERKGDYLVVD